MGLGTTHIVIMGHSTGSQDVAHYLSTRSTPQVIGGILQAPISDRHEIEESESKIHCDIREALPEATGLIKEGKGETVLDFKMWGTVDITAYRLYSLSAVGYVLFTMRRTEEQWGRRLLLPRYP